MIIRIISGNTQCIDKNLLNYDVHYSCTISYSIFKYFKVNKNIAILTNIIEDTLRSIIIDSYLKVFHIPNLTTEEKEYNTYVDITQTNIAQHCVNENIRQTLVNEFNKYGCNIKKFEIIPFDICHSLRAALS